MTIHSAGLYKVQASRTLKERFDAKCSKPDSNGCIHWLGALLENGYGKIHFGRQKLVAAHRAAWVIYKGDLSTFDLVLHKCDVRTCVNPDHLFIGSPADNVRDMVSKDKHFGTEWRKKKAGHFDRIVGLRKEGYLHREIAAWLGVSQTSVTNVLAGKYKFTGDSLG